MFVSAMRGFGAAKLAAACAVSGAALLFGLKWQRQDPQLTFGWLAQVSRSRLSERAGDAAAVAAIGFPWTQLNELSRSSFLRPPLPRVGHMRALLKSHYGIEVADSVTAMDLVHVLMFARVHRPEETRGLTFEFAPMSERISDNGHLGEWVAGIAHINSDRADTIFHEGTHHILELPRNVRGQKLGQQIYEAALAAGGGRIPNSCISRAYGRTERKAGDYSEFEAELVTGIAGLELGLPVETTITNPAFDPPSAIRELVRQIWVNPGHMAMDLVAGAAL
jgi:hypothetical protein